MDEKLLPTTNCGLDEAERDRLVRTLCGTFGVPDITTATLLDECNKKLLLNSIYGAKNISYIEPKELYPKHLVAKEDIPTYMNDQAWIDIGKTYVIPDLRRDIILGMAERMIADAGYPDKENVRILAGARIMITLSVAEYIPRYINTAEGITFVYDKTLGHRDLKLQQKRVTMRYDQFFKTQPWGKKLSSPVLSLSAVNGLMDNASTAAWRNDLNDATTRAIAALRDCFKNINMEDTDMLGKSVEIKKVIYSNPATIVYWMDGDKTVVRCKDEDTYSKEVGLLMCLAKRVWGKNESGSNFNDYMRKYISEEK